jgi:hypothetical protein
MVGLRRWCMAGGREDLVGVAHDGMDHQVDSVGEDVTKLSSFYNLSVSHPFFPWCTLSQREIVYCIYCSFYRRM